jgi:hypothetical protein
MKLHYGTGYCLLSTWSCFETGALAHPDEHRGDVAMDPKRKDAGFRALLVILCTVVLAPGDTLAYAASSWQASASPSQNQPSKIPAEQLDSLVAPIALYPDPLLAQTLAASTYPLEIIQLQQWLVKNKNLKDKALADAVGKESWDPSVQALAALPDVVKRLADDIRWTTDLGNAFLAQQSDVMDAVQRMRKKAQDKGNLKSSEQQKVETKVIENKSVIVVEQANPQVVYVPSYDPVVVYGPAYYPYPPLCYPPAGYYAADIAISFGMGVMMGAFWSGGWGWGADGAAATTTSPSIKTTISTGTRTSIAATGPRIQSRAAAIAATLAVLVGLARWAVLAEWVVLTGAIAAAII